MIMRVTAAETLWRLEAGGGRQEVGGRKQETGGARRRVRNGVQVGRQERQGAGRSERQEAGDAS